MTDTETLADLIALSIHAAVEPLRLEIAALKSLAMIPGPAGPAGRDGIDGKDGEGLPGKDGRDGIDGKDGAAGLNGKDGQDGLNGKDGAAGLNGKDGRDAVLDSSVLATITARLNDVEVKAALAQRIERDVLALKTQILSVKSIDADDEIPADRVAALITETLIQELAAIGAPSWSS